MVKFGTVFFLIKIMNCRVKVKIINFIVRDKEHKVSVQEKWGLCSSELAFLSRE